MRIRAFLVAVLLLVRIRAAADEGVATDAAFASHLAEVKRTAPKGFTVVAEPPFVVIGDEPAEMVQRRAEQTVKSTVRLLKQDYFSRDPVETIDIWLFRDKESYTNHAWTLFRDTPDTPFGYYSAAHDALVMNIATGGGTLVHEIVHPFIHANFPRCPAWFNEGLASLLRGFHGKGRPHSRLGQLALHGSGKGYQGAENDFVQRKLTGTTDDEFYGRVNGASYNQYYAQARYLCYYLQERGLLVKYYRDFVANVKTDPTGYATLKAVLGEKDMEAFRKRWEKFVLEIRAPQ